MKDILRTSLLEYDKSSFLIDLIKHETGNLYVEITQTISFAETSKKTLKINSKALEDLILVLSGYQEEIVNKKKKQFSEMDQEKMIQFYMKGLTIKDIAFQFNSEIEEVELELIQLGFDIVSNELPPKRKIRMKNSRFSTNKI